MPAVKFLETTRRFLSQILAITDTIAIAVSLDGTPRVTPAMNCKTFDKQEQEPTTGRRARDSGL